jgi:two-component system, LuxR family, response regulator FixJ
MMFEPVVYLVDDDPAVRDALSLLIRSIGLNVIVFEHAQHFLDHYDPGHVACLVLDIRMPDMNGLALQEALRVAGHAVPVIFITGHGDVAQCTRAFKAGAADFLAKPIDEQALIDSLQRAIKASIALHRRHAMDAQIHQKLGRLTERENDVLRLIVDGLPNKLIARRLDVSTRTVESHRAKVFEKLEVDSLAECVKMHVAVRGN